MTRARLARNRIRCKNCGEVIESRHRHDLVRCRCGRVGVDGGTEYLRRTYPADQSPEEAYEELSERVREKAAQDRPRRIQVLATADQLKAWREFAGRRELSLSSMFRATILGWNGEELPEERPGPYTAVTWLCVGASSGEELKAQAEERGLSLSSLIRRLMDRRVSEMAESA